ncbi:MAG: hypothetical protein OJF50_006755 [Nitrospira sp.]|jgi:hypothetical protein|nr:hypothetical protein [Nitrospira sp.]
MEQEITLPQEVSDEVLIGRLRQWASELTPQEAANVLATCSAESLIAYQRSRNRPLPSDPHKLWGLFAAELLARTETLNMGTA